MTSHLAQAAVLLPALFAVASLGAGRRAASAYALSLLGTAAGFVAALMLLVQVLSQPVTQHLSTIGGLPLGSSLRAPLELHVTDVGVLVACVVLAVSFVVQMFARWYLFYDPRYRAFTATVTLFTAAMVLVVLSGDVLLTLTGWELMAWCSYVLIGHESDLPSARRASLKAFLVTRVGDAPFVAGLALLAAGAHSTRVNDILTWWSQGEHGHLRLYALLGLICGVLAKSAQFPFTDWLPDAMEGPTPASALIHAATMVAAGTVVLAQFMPLLAAEPTARFVLVVIAGATSLFACFAAFCQPDLKRLLAWSTISQVGLMLLSLGAVAPGQQPDAALLHLVGHAFFKSLLFLMVGWLSIAAGATLVTRMSGAIRRLPVTFGLVAVGLFTMAGMPPTVAFISKDAMLDDAATGQADGRLIATVALVFLALIVIGTAAYSTRAWFVLQHRTTLERRGEQRVLADSHRSRDVDVVELLRSAPEVDEHGDELNVEEDEDEDEVLPRPGVPVRVGLWGLAVGSVAGGLLVLTPLFGTHLRHLNLPLAGASFLLVIATALVVRVLSLHQLYGDAARRLPRRLPLAASRGFGLEHVYMGLVARPVLVLARGVARADDGLDQGVRSLAHGNDRFGALLDRLHTRRPSTGLAWVVVGVVVASVLGVTLW